MKVKIQDLLKLKKEEFHGRVAKVIKFHDLSKKGKKMDLHNFVKISKTVFGVGAKDWKRRLFDDLIQLPEGTTYNSYLVIGQKKNALIDTVNPGFEQVLEDNIKRIIDPMKIDYLVMNHAEPDHAGAIPHIMKISKKAKLVTTAFGAKLAKIYYKVPDKRIIIVRDNDVINLGGKTLRFIEAPMLHWPETMFTYLEEDRILFSCDFFGSHVAKGYYDNEVNDIVYQAQRYFGEIMMPFKEMGRKALDKIGTLENYMIAPSHGPIYRNAESILGHYNNWVDGVAKNKVLVIYATMWNSTEKMVHAMVQSLVNKKIEVAVYDLAHSDSGDIIKDLVDSRAIVIGAPAVLGGAHPLALYVTSLAVALRPAAKFGAILSSYGWGGGAAASLAKVMEPLKLEVSGVIEVNGPPTKEDIKRIKSLGEKIAEQVKK